MTADAQITALKDLTESEGWQLYRQHMADSWGPEAFERAIDEALKHADPVDSVAITMRIRDTFKGVRASLTWPEEQIRSLQSPTKSITDRFRGFRRA